MHPFEDEDDFKLPSENVADWQNHWGQNDFLSRAEWPLLRESWMIESLVGNRQGSLLGRRKDSLIEAVEPKRCGFYKIIYDKIIAETDPGTHFREAFGSSKWPRLTIACSEPGDYALLRCWTRIGAGSLMLALGWKGPLGPTCL